MEGSIIGVFSISSALWVLWRFCVVFIDTVPILSITARSGGQLLDGQRGVRGAAGQCFGSVIVFFLLYTSELFSILENKLIVYDDDSTLVAVAPSPGVRVAVAESLNRDLSRVSEWCNLYGMKLNASNY